MSRGKLTRDVVLDAALEFVAEHGLEGLSMRTLGARLGVEGMALYYYVPNKADLLDGLVERMAVRVFAARLDLGLPWPEFLRGFAVALRDELLVQPRLLPLLATRPVMTPASLSAVERIAEGLVAQGFSAIAAFRAINAVATFTLGHTLAEAGSTPGHEDADPDPTMLDLDGLPLFGEAVRQGLGGARDHQERFDYALSALLRGMSA